MHGWISRGRSSMKKEDFHSLSVSEWVLSLLNHGNVFLTFSLLPSLPQPIKFVLHHPPSLPGLLCSPSPFSSAFGSPHFQKTPCKIFQRRLSQIPVVENLNLSLRPLIEGRKEPCSGCLLLGNNREFLKLFYLGKVF